MVDFAFPLFIVLWLLAALLIWMSIGVVRTALSFSTGDVPVLRGSILAVRVALVEWLAWIWVSWVMDQWPCLLGASGC